MRSLQKYFWRVFVVLACSSSPGYSFAQNDYEYYEEENTDNDQSAFDSIYYFPEEVKVRNISDSTKARMLRDEDYWYVNLSPPRAEKKRVEEYKRNPSIFEKDWFKNLVWIILIGVFVGALLWFLATSNISLFARKKQFIVEEEDELTEEDLFNIEFEKQIYKAEADNNFRLATRLWFLHSIKLLSERNLIRYQPDLTNTQYLDQLFTTNYYKDFFNLTRKFEYIWYGKFEPSGEQYVQIKNEFQAFKSRMGS